MCKFLPIYSPKIYITLSPGNYSSLYVFIVCLYVFIVILHLVKKILNCLCKALSTLTCYTNKTALSCCITVQHSKWQLQKKCMCFFNKVSILSARQSGINISASEKIRDVSLKAAIVFTESSLKTNVLDVESWPSCLSHFHWPRVHISFQVTENIISKQTFIGEYVFSRQTHYFVYSFTCDFSWSVVSLRGENDASHFQQLKVHELCGPEAVGTPDSQRHQLSRWGKPNFRKMKMEFTYKCYRKFTKIPLGLVTITCT